MSHVVFCADERKMPHSNMIFSHKASMMPPKLSALPSPTI